MKVLQIIQSAYRCTIEEQDDPAVWVAHAMKKADANLAILLRGNAVNYASKDQDAAGLSIGGVQQTQPPKIGREIQRFMEQDVPVYLVSEDAALRGIHVDEIASGIEFISRDRLPSLFHDYDQVWHW